MSSRRFGKGSIADLTKIIIFLGFLFFITIPSNAQEKEDPKWFACKEDSQCVLIKGSCQNDLAVNKNFADDAQEYYRKLWSMQECARNPNYKPVEVVPICTANKCALKKTDEINK